MTRDTEKCPYSILTTLTYEQICEFSSVQTHRSFYTGVRIKRKCGVPLHFINNFFTGGSSVDGGVHS